MSAFDKVIGYEKEKKMLFQVLDMIREPEKHEKIGAKLPQGVLISGIPGIGKTLLAKSFIDRNEAVTLAEMERYMLKARDILLKNREYLMKVWEELTEKKVLLNSDVKRIRESVKVVEVTV